MFPNIAGACERVGAIEAHASLPQPLRDTTTPSTLFQLFLLFRHHVATLDRKSFGRLGSEGKHYLRLSIATSMEQLKLGMARLEHATNDSDGFRDFVSEGRHLN